MSDTDALSALFEEPNAPRERRRPGRGFAIAAWIVGVLVVLLVAAYLVADNWLRSTAERVAESAVAQALPEGTVTGTLRVKIDGPSVILQYLSGSFDQVEVDAPGLTLAGVTAPAHIVATGVPTSIRGTVQSVSIDLALDAKSLTALLGGTGTVTALGPGTITVTENTTAD
ncbi:MAG: LmeA family phospholipid-binding protein, partial [Microbacteriaceae bacterium]